MCSIYEIDRQVEQYIILLKQRENQLEKTNQTLAERDKKLDETNKLLIDTIHQVKQRENQLEKRENQLEKQDVEMRMRKKQMDEVTTVKTNSGEKVTMTAYAIHLEYMMLFIDGDSFSSSSTINTFILMQI